MLLLLALFAPLASCVDVEPLTDCVEINTYLAGKPKSENTGCRCYVTSESIPRGTWIGCHDTGMFEIGTAFKQLPRSAVVDKLWIWSSVVPMLVDIANLKARHVIIQNTKLRKFDPTAFQGLRETVEILELRSNEITEIPAVFENMTKLTSLDLSGNKITKISRDSLAPLRSENLEFLSFYKNNLVDIEPGAFRMFPNLKRLDLAENLFSALSDGLFDGLSNVEHLNLAGNKLSAVSAPAMTALRNLERLEVSGNNLSELTLSDLPKLQKLLVGNNKIASLADISLKGVSTLKNLNLDRNRISVLEPAPLFDQLSSLRVFSLTHNRITRIAPNTLQSLKSLQTLSLQQNRLESIAEGTFSGQKELKNLFVQQNMIDMIPADAFRGLSGLSILSLAHNKLSEVHPVAFKGMESLTKLYINDNELTTLSNKSLAALEENVNTLDVSDNPWHCDCDLAWMALWARAGKIDLSTSNTLCQAPEKETMREAFASLHEVCAAGGDPGARRPKNEDNGWITALGIVLAILSLMVLGAIVALYLRDHHSARRIYALHKLHALSRVPSDMRLLMKPSASTSA